MAASANKSTGLQVALIFSIAIVAIMAVVAFLQFRSAKEADANLLSEKSERTKADADKQSLQGNLDTLRGFIGSKAAEIGKPDAEGDNTVIGQAKQVMVRVAPGDLIKPTVMETFERLGQEVNGLRQDKASLTAESLQLKQKITDLEAEYQARVDRSDKARQDAEKDREQAQASKEKAVEGKDKELNERLTKIQELQQSLQKTQSDFNGFVDTAKKDMARLTEINRGLRQKTKDLTATTFDEPSGTIQLVDREINLVWLNRGSDDGLRKGTTFSVYKQINKGVARGSQDIKGAIEVTKITGPHMAEARITRFDIGDPIIPGDPVYTPLWRPGRRENFAIVGLVDMDNDGVSDRQTLHDLVAAANGAITDEVDDMGIRHPAEGSINVGTKFLVIGKIPDSTDSLPDRKNADRKIGQLSELMRRQAEEHGVRVVSLEDFLNYVGYEPGRRVWRAGVTDRWNLKQGAQNVGRPDVIKRPESGGTTSEIFKSGPKKKQIESAGPRSVPGK